MAKCSRCGKTLGDKRSRQCFPCYKATIPPRAEEKKKCNRCGNALGDKRSKQCYQCYKTAMLPRVAVLSVDDIMAHTGLLQTDAAAMLGISYQHFRQVVKRLNIRHLFPAKGGETKKIVVGGYIGGLDNEIY